MSAATTAPQNEAYWELVNGIKEVVKDLQDTNPGDPNIERLESLIANYDSFANSVIKEFQELLNHTTVENIELKSKLQALKSFVPKPGVLTRQNSSSLGVNVEDYIVKLKTTGVTHFKNTNDFDKMQKEFEEANKKHNAKAMKSKSRTTSQKIGRAEAAIKRATLEIPQLMIEKQLCDKHITRKEVKDKLKKKSEKRLADFVKKEKEKLEKAVEDALSGGDVSALLCSQDSDTEVD
tara:strand:- start:192 stop:899 length:708 start_codon:yes stop_codon:yes gene_type:complete